MGQPFELGQLANYITVNDSDLTVGIGTSVVIEGTLIATKFFGDGSSLGNAGAEISVGTGDQNLVMTNTTSGIMTEAAVDSRLTYNSSTAVLSAIGFSGSGAQLTNIPTTGLTTNTVSFGGVTLGIGESEAYPAFDLTNATNYPTTSLNGTISNSQLAGSISNDKLSNSTISFGGISLSLGGSDSSPAFDLTDATKYPYTSLTGVTTDIIGDLTPQLGGNLDLNSKTIQGTGDINITGTVTATTLSGPLSGNVTGDVTGDLTGDVTGNLTGNVTGNVSGIATFTSEWTLGADIGNTYYTFFGSGFNGTEQDPDIFLVRGQRYKFTNNIGSHPFRIQSTPNGSLGSQYNDGLSTNDVDNGTIEWNVLMDAPQVLYYQCTSHSGMGGKIYIHDPSANPTSLVVSGIVTASSFLKTGGTSSEFLKADGTVSQIIVSTSDPNPAVGVDGDIWIKYTS